MNEVTKNKLKPNLLTLILVISFPSVATVLITPALPAMAHYFQISGSYAQQLITVFIVGYAFGPLIYSPLANRFGRKIALYLGISLYLLSCLVCFLGIYLHNIEMIFLGRFVMALGSSAGLIISFTVINDFYPPKEARLIMSYTMLAFALMPAFSVFLGGFITAHLSWIACFYFLFIYGLFTFLVSTRLPETLHEKDLSALNIKPMLKSFKIAFSNLRLMLFSTIYGLFVAFIYIISTGAPFIAINKMGLSPAHYGSLLLIGYLGQVVGSLSAGHLNKRLSAYAIVYLSFACVIAGTLLMFFSFWFQWITVFSLIISLFFIMLGLPISYSSTTVMALTDYKDKATGSAVMSFTAMFIALIATFLLTRFPAKDPMVMPSLFIVILLINSLLFFFATKRFPEY